MNEKFKFTQYTKNMYLSSKSFWWSYFNNLRLKKLKKLFSKYDSNFDKIIEFGSYDLYFSTTKLKFFQRKNCSKYTFTDLYDSKEIKSILKHNLAIIKNKFEKISFNAIPSKGEVIDKKISSKYGSVLIFETLEHVQDEKKVISNLNKLLRLEGYVFVGAPVEFGLMFFFKEMGRLVFLGRTNHNLKEIFFATFGMMNFVKPQVGSHKGYDFRRTKKLFLKKGFILVEQKTYPNRLLPYGVTMLFKKVKNI